MTEINWLAALLATIAYFMLGAAWFTPLFGRAWDRSIGYDRSVTQGKFPLSYYLVPLAGAAIGTVVVAAFVELVEADGVFDGMAVGVGVGLAVAAATLTNALTPHTPKPYLFAAITGGYHLTGLVIAGAIIGAFG